MEIDRMDTDRQKLMLMVWRQIDREADIGQLCY